MVEVRLAKQGRRYSPRQCCADGRHSVLAVMVMLAAGCTEKSATPLSDAYYSGPISNHFDGQRFYNPDGQSEAGGARSRGVSDLVGMVLGLSHHRPYPWPSSVPVTLSIPPRRVEGQALLVTWIGHASTLVQTQGLNILFDPVWASRDSPVPFLGPKRVRAPGVRLADLPPIDLVLISHDHYDHLDIGTLKFLYQRDRPIIVTGLGNDRLLASDGIPAVARDWGDRVRVRPDIEVVITRAHHWSSRWIGKPDRRLWCGFRVTLPGGDLYYAGDTGPGDMHWAVEAKGVDPIRFAILPIGPYKIDTPPTGNHIDPLEAVKVFQQLDAAFALGVHWGTFELGPEPIDGSPRLLVKALAERNIGAERFRTIEAGESWSIPQRADR